MSVSYLRVFNMHLVWHFPQIYYAAQLFFFKVLMQIQPIPAIFEVICIFINPVKLIAEISIVKVTIILAINSRHHNLFYI